MEAPFGEYQWNRKNQATAKVSKTGIGFRALSSVSSSPTRDTRVSCSGSNATAKGCVSFTVLGFSNFSVTQFCSEGGFVWLVVVFFFPYSMQAFLFNLRLA